MMRPGRSRQRFRSALLEEALDPQPLRPNALEVELRRTRARDDDQVDPRRQKVGVGPKALAAEAFDPVSLDGAADPAAHDQPEARRSGPALGRQEEREVRGSHAARAAIALRARELRMAAESAIGAEGHDCAA